MRIAKVTAGATAILILSVVGVTFLRSGTTRPIPHVDSASKRARSPEACRVATAWPNLALAGMKLDDFSRGALVTLTPCELITLETQLGADEEPLAKLGL